MALRIAKTDRQQWTRLQSLFQQALEMEASRRHSFIYEQTVDDADLREQLIAMLANISRAGPSPLSRAIGIASAHVLQDQRQSLLGRVLGSYRLTSILGQGGTGTVYLAERADRQYSARVACKVIDTAALQVGLDGRFRAERQILANLNHPNIARLLDAGETETGQPYLVMEYVEGEPLDQYCDRRHLNLRERLRLFLEICAAVQYAHQNLVIHRDLKPANILVTEDGTPKLLDFGIAKLLRSNDHRSLPDLTRVADRLLTPEYASPEQILGGTITTASDVYSLGVILYELVCGLRPYKVPASYSQLELERAICLSDPEKPSAALLHAITANEFPVADIASARSTSVERLRRNLAGDIDAIVMKALRKEPQHRYSSAEQLADDIRRYLNDEPVKARQGNWLYYGQRFARRHTAGVIASVGFLLFVIGVAIVMSVQRQQIALALERATQDGRRAEMVSEFMLNVFSAADPYMHFGKEPTARTLLEQAAERIRADLGQQPDVRARLLEAIGVSYMRMGHSDRALSFLEEALEIHRQLKASDATIGPVLAALAVAQREAARYEESDRTLAEALKVAQRVSNTRSEQYATLLIDLARLEMLRGNVQQAQAHLNSAYEVVKSLRGPDDPRVGIILMDLSNTFVWANDLVQAERYAKDAVRIYSRVPETHPDRIFAEANLARILVYRDRLDDAEPILKRVLAAQRFVYGSNNNAVADTLGLLAQLSIAKQDFNAAEGLVREALDIHEQAGSTVTLKIGFLRTILGTVLLKKRKLHEAERILRDTLELFAKNLPADHQYVASAEYYLGETLLAQGKLADAEATLIASMHRWRRTDAPEWRVARSKNALGEVFLKQGRYAEAEQYLTTTFRQLTTDGGADRDAKRMARERIAQLYESRGQQEKLTALLREISDRRAHLK